MMRIKEGPGGMDACRCDWCGDHFLATGTVRPSGKFKAWDTVMGPTPEWALEEARRTDLCMFCQADQRRTSAKN